MKLKSRRTFIKNTALAATGFSLMSTAKSYANIMGANDRVNLVTAGLNGRGQGHLTALKKFGQKAKVIGLCDVDKRVFKKSMKLIADDKVQLYGDFRKALENNDVDAVTIATPDHWHTPMGILCMQAGKHVYLEKPLSHNPWEGATLVASQKKEGKVLQIGNQQRSGPTSISAVQDIREGIIGEVYHGKAWYANTRGSIGIGKVQNVPSELDWDLWQGPAPRTKYKDNIVHYNWHWFWNWGTGEVNNNGLHELDICRWAMGVDLPQSVNSSGGRFNFDDDWEFYDTQIVNYQFANNKMITWEGRSCNGHKFFERGRGVTIHGTKGTILMDRNAYLAYDNSGNLIKQENERTQSATTDTVGIGGLDYNHFNNFIQAINSGVKLNSPVHDIDISNTMCHLGNYAQKFGRTLNLDPATGKILDDPEAMKMWEREYEKGWKPKI